MTDGAGFDDRYVRYREYSEHQRETEAAMSAIREKHGALEAAVIQQITGMRGDINSLTRAVESRAANAPNLDQASLALQRALSLAQSPANGLHPLLYMLAGILLLGAGVLAAKFL